MTAFLVGLAIGIYYVLIILFCMSVAAAVVFGVLWLHEGRRINKIIKSYDKEKATP